MRVCHQERAAHGTDQREYQARPPRVDSLHLDGPFEDGEQYDQQHEKSVLRNFCHLKAFPEAARSQRPVFRVGPDQQKHRQSKENERPMPGPRKAS